MTIELPRDDFNAETILSQKLRARLKGFIERNGGRIFTDATQNRSPFSHMLNPPIHDRESLNLYNKISKYRREAYFENRTSSYGSAFDTWEDGDETASNKLAHLNKDNLDFEKQVNDYLHDGIITYFSSLTVDEQLTLTRPQKRARVRGIQSGKLPGFGTISLAPYLSHFIRYLCNSEATESFYEFSWKMEDWETDAMTIIRGHLISQSLRNGKGVHLETPTALEAKKQASQYLPKVGADETRLALSATPSIDQGTLPDIWKADAFSPSTLPDDMNGEPQADIIHADDNYILLHLKNESAAKAFGSNAWCVTYGHWQSYSDNFMCLCDTDGNRYGIHLTGQQCVDEADLQVDLSELFERYGGIENSVVRFWRQQIQQSISSKNSDVLFDLLLPLTLGGSKLLHGKEDVNFISRIFEKDWIKQAFIEFIPNDEIAKFHNVMLDFFDSTEQRRALYIEKNYSSILFYLYEADKISIESLRAKTTTLRCVLGSSIDPSMTVNWDNFYKTEKGKLVKELENTNRQQHPDNRKHLNM